MPTPKLIDAVTDLAKALEAGNYDAAPSTLVQGPALQIEDLSNVMNVVTFENDALKLAKMIGVTSCKATLAQFDRQLSYGTFGGSAQLEGNVGLENTSDFVRIAVPMAFYSSIRRVSIASTLVATVDGKKSDERSAQDEALRLAGDIEFDCFGGLDNFSNAGVFDGNPLMIPGLPAMHGMQLQIRQSDGQANARDKMFAEYGSDETVVVSVGTALTQDKVEDAAVRSTLNFGNAKRLMIDPVSLSAYNKITFGKERIILAGSPQNATGGDLTRQWVSGGTVNVEASHFLRGKFKPRAARAVGPAAPTISTALVSSSTPFTVGQVYIYFATTVNENGESTASATDTETIANAGEKVEVTITHPSGTFRSFNVYRTEPGGAAATAKFIGSVIATAGSSTTVFTDLGNKLPGFVTGVLVDPRGWELRELAPYSRLKLGVSDLSIPEAHFRFLTLVGEMPRMSVVVDNIKGTF